MTPDQKQIARIILSAACGGAIGLIVVAAAMGIARLIP